MGRLTRDGTAETVSRDQILRRERGQGNIHFLCSADHEQDWQPYPRFIVTLPICDDHTTNPGVAPKLSKEGSGKCFSGSILCSFVAPDGSQERTRRQTELVLARKLALT